MMEARICIYFLLPGGVVFACIVVMFLLFCFPLKCFQIVCERVVSCVVF